MDTHAQLLASAPGSCAEIRKEISQTHGLNFQGAGYKSLWRNLTEVFGKEGAAAVVEDFVDYRTKRKVLEKAMGRGSKSYIEAVLTDDRIKLQKRARKLLRSAAKTPKPPSQKKTRRKIPDHSKISLPSTDYGSGFLRSKALAYQPILRQTPEGETALRGRSSWLEKHLENYIENHWEELDFNLGRELRLMDRQVRLSSTQERVDLLASTGDVILPIELKIKQAGGSDLTQLQSYRKDLINSGHEPINVLGVLVAPRFSSKVLNVVDGMPGIILRWFELPL